MDNSQERFVRREESSPAREGVALHHALASVLRQNLDDTSTICTSGLVPLEVTTGVLKDGIKLVGDKFVGREDAEGLRVST